MIIECIQRYAIERPDQVFLSDDAASLTFRAAELRVRQMAVGFREAGMLPGSTTYLYARDSALSTIALLATQYAGSQVCVLNRNFGTEDLRRISLRLKPGPLVSDCPDVNGWPGPIFRLTEPDGPGDPPAGPMEGGEGGIVILTTGTTGVPKAVLHDWGRLLAQVRMADSSQSRAWALLYPLNHFAGLQVLLHVVKNGLTLAIPRDRQFSNVWECLLRNRVDSVSATPTFWRMFTGQLSAIQAGQLSLRQITLGGEPVGEGILSRLRQLFPEARITQVFATTEIGSCFAVSDGRPGFPAEFLEGSIGNVQLTIRDGQLYVRTATGMVAYVDGSPPPETAGDDWMATGDLVEICDGRVHFLGRKGEVLNVGGVKVYPPTVEEQIRKVNGVRDVRVYGKPNPIAGQIVAADLELSDGADADAVLVSVRQVCRATLNRYEQPRELRVVSELRRSNEKLIRR